MIRATQIRSAGLWPPERASDRITLDFDQRHRRRLRLQGEAGCAFLLDLAEARLLRDGDALQLEDGRLVEVRAAPERLAELTCADPLALVRLAWHLGNRHCPTQVRDGALRIRWDHVLAGMAHKLGALVREIEAPFDPEGGAYANGHGHDHL